jgi:hypothetical protein
MQSPPQMELHTSIPARKSRDFSCPDTFHFGIGFVLPIISQLCSTKFRLGSFCQFFHVGFVRFLNAQSMMATSLCFMPQFVVLHVHLRG